MWSLARCVDADTLCMDNSYQPMYFMSKYPEEVSPVWNIVRLFKPLIWGAVFFSLFLVIAFFAISSKTYQKMGFRNSLRTTEIQLAPNGLFRLVYCIRQLTLSFSHCTFIV